MSNHAIVYVIDDDHITLESLSWIISSVGHQVKSYTNAQDFLDNYNPQIPGCLLLDAKMPGMSGPELQKNIKNNHQISLPIIFISGIDDAALATRVMKEGAIDFITKPLNPQILLESINVALRVDQEAREKNEKMNQKKLIFTHLSPREKQILKGIIDGKPNKLISTEMKVSLKTVEAHRASLMRKVGVKSVSALIKMFFCIEKDTLDHIFNYISENPEE